MFIPTYLKHGEISNISKKKIHEFLMHSTYLTYGECTIFELVFLMQIGLYR